MPFACHGFLKCKRTWIGVPIGVAIAAVFAWCWYTLGQPDPIQPDQKFEIQFGRGSGWHGLDLLRITSDGEAWFEYQTETDNGVWHRKRFHVGDQRLADLRDAINALNPWGMAAAYHGNVHDGTQWVLLVRVDGKSKSVYFDNNFPGRITQFAGFIDRAILEPLAEPIAPEVVPARHHRKHEKDIWASIH